MADQSLQISPVFLYETDLTEPMPRQPPPYIHPV